MKKILLLIFFVILTIVATLIFQGSGERKGLQLENILQNSTPEQTSAPAEEEIVRKPAVAGQFYQADAQKLKAEINQFLDQADLIEVEGEIISLILPHAGYDFSGQVAAYGFKQLIDQPIDTVILIGNSHKERFEGISVFNQGFYETPLGQVAIDQALAEAIMSQDQRIIFKESAHQTEHSLEVELPFLQEVLDDFKIVPILFGNSSLDDYQILAQALINTIKGKNVLLIASSDLSHYPSYQNAQYADSKTINSILTGQVQKLEETIQGLEQEQFSNLSTLACGIDAIKTIILVSKELGANQIRLLSQANSGDVSEDKDRVVGYGAIGFFGERRGNLLNKIEQKELLNIAKASIENFVKTGEILEFEVELEALKQRLGAFVTLNKDDQLRGCLGIFSPTSIPLHQVVAEIAIAAASQDKRFNPVTEQELDQLDYEISVLSDLTEIDHWQEIELGKHGVRIEKGFRSGVFLPQVATDNNWDLDKFMGELCSQKAGLAWDCWKQEDTQLFIFTAQVFE